MRYTPLEEVNQAIYAWSYRQTKNENFGQLVAKTLLKDVVKTLARDIAMIHFDDNYKRSTTRQVPRRSPIQVLTPLDVA